MDQENNTHLPVKQFTISEFLESLNKELRDKRSANNIINLDTVRKKIVQGRAHHDNSIQSALNYAKTLDW